VMMVERVSAWIERRFGLFVGLLVVLYVLSRLPLLGHVLSFDEAWNALAIRNLCENTAGPFRFNFLRHPPLYMLLGQLVSMGSTTPAVRLEILTLCIHAAACGLVMVLVRRGWGASCALWAGVAWIAMPVALLFDTWIKRDCLVALFGLLALMFWQRKRDLVAGIFLGLAFLSKETAIFYAGVVFLLGFMPPFSKADMMRVLRVAGVSLLISCWWFLLLWRGGGGYLAFFSGSSNESDWFSQPFHYYFSTMPYSLGWGGVVLACVGAGRMIAKLRVTGAVLAQLIWPLLLVVPALGLLSLSVGKPYWLLMVMIPGFAALIGVGAHGVLAWGLKRCSGRHAACGLGAGVCLTVLLLLVQFPGLKSYHDRAWPVIEGAVGLGEMSRDAAELINRRTSPDDRLLLTPMAYVQQGHCTVFHYYIEPREVLFVQKETPFEEMLRMIKEYQLDWAYISPGPYPADQPITKQFDALIKADLELLPGGVLIPLSELQ
jgi:4-amino-4-deoxy-L-arabinose transferase-like glycosyltransferase